MIFFPYCPRPGAGAPNCWPFFKRLLINILFSHRGSKILPILTNRYSILLFQLLLCIFWSRQGLYSHNWELFTTDNNHSYISTQISIWNEHSSLHTDITITSVSRFNLQGVETYKLFRICEECLKRFQYA